MRGAPVLAALALAACAGPVHAPPAAVVATADRGLAARGSSSFVLRTEAPGLLRPVAQAGIPCRLQARGFHASFTSPAEITVPNLGRRQPEATVTCTHGGRRQSLALEPVNLTRAEEQSRAMAENQADSPGFPGLGLVTAAIVGGLRPSRPSDVWGYRNATLTFGD